ncbi:MAG: pilin [Patescibacteria group bacterium]
MFGLIHTVLAAGETSTDIKLVPSTDDFETLSPENLTIASLISGLITFALVIAAIVFFFMLVIGGIKWILSGGDKGQTESARNQITAALVGLVIVFSAWAIAQLIKAFFGVDIFTLELPTAFI